MLKRQVDKNIEQKPVWVDVVHADKKNKNRRIVQTSDGERVDTPKADAFLGRQNQVFEQQTVSRSRFSQMSSDARQAQSRKALPEARREKEKILSQFGISILPDASLLRQKNSQDIPEWATPGTRPEDFVEGIRESDRTALNTREFVFYGYFQRIRERLDRAWVPILRQKLITYYRTGRHLASDMDHTTRVIVVLNEKGEIVRVEMISESGAKPLDDAAVAAFNKAGPFPNPPKGIVDRNREVKIPWDFVLKT